LYSAVDQAGASTEVAEALEAVGAAGSAARNTLVSDHEKTAASQTAAVLDRNFQVEYQALKDRIALSLGRLSVIENVLREKRDLLGGYQPRSNAARERVSLTDKDLRGSMDVLAAGGYRRAFEILDGVSAQIRESENIIAELEIEITTSLVGALEDSNGVRPQF